MEGRALRCHERGSRVGSRSVPNSMGEMSVLASHPDFGWRETMCSCKSTLPARVATRSTTAQ